MRSSKPASPAASPGPKLHVVQLSLGEQMGASLLARLQHAKPPSPAKVGAAKPRDSTSNPATPASPAKLAAAKPRGRDELAQTEPVLLEALPFPLPGCTGGTQTDAFASAHAAPPPPLRKAGVDAATSIEAGDLFDFEREVTPVLERLVGGALDAAASEAAAEMRLEAVRRQRKQIEEARYRELVEVQRMQGDDRRRREAEQRAREVAEEKARRAAALQAKLEALALAREMVQGALGSVQSRAQQRPSSSASQLSFGRAAEAEVIAYLEAAGTGQLRAMRMSTSRSGSLASSRGGSRRSTLQYTGLPQVSFAGGQGSGRRESGGDVSATAALPAAADVVVRTSGGGEPPAPARPLTALAAGAAIQALDQAVTEVELGGAAKAGAASTAAPEAEGAATPGWEAEPMDVSPPEQGVLATEGTVAAGAPVAKQAAPAGLSAGSVDEGSSQEATAVASVSLPEPGAEVVAPEVQAVAGELAALERSEADAAAEAAAEQETS